ncbi:MAG: hypothetical protein ACI9FR_000432 [Cryomorphaceae bacterium]|jgi:hypothetical protein
MLRPANERLAFATLLVGSFGLIIGVVWIGSRASISTLVQMPISDEINAAIALYELRYETLLQVTRITTLFVSAVIIALSLSGRSHYPRWMAVFNPILLILMSFLSFVLMPSVGKHLMPIALNVAFFIFFAMSLSQTRKVEFV